MGNNDSGFCANCGRPLVPGSSFCGNCGAGRSNVQNGNATPYNNANVQAAPAIVGPVVPPVVSASPVMPPAPSLQMTVDPVVPTKTVRKEQKKRLTWLWATVVTILILVIVSVIVFKGIGGGKDRTIMVYMIGSNLESEFAAASLDIQEMEEADFDAEHTKVLIYTGGAKKWALDEISAEENAIFEVVDGGIKKVQTYEKSLMTNPGNLTDFINFAYENYSSDLYDLILWDHGGGPIFGYGLDDNSMANATMKIPQLVSALENSELIKGGKKFEFIGFDACLMGSIETANMLRNYSDYMIASEEVEPGNGWNYAFLDVLGEEEAVDTEEFGKNIVDYYIAHYDGYYYDVDLSLAMINLKKLDKIIEPASDLFSSVKDEMNIQNFSSYSRTMTRNKVYGYSGRNSESYDLVDLMDLCGSLEGSYGDKVAKVREGLSEVVVYSRSNMKNTNGISVYFLNYNKELADKMLAKYQDVAFSDDYYNFLMKYKDFVTGERLVSRSVYNNLAEDKLDGAITVELPDELRDNYQSAEIIVFRKIGENKFMPIYRSSEVELVGSSLRATSYNLQFVIEVTSEEEGVDYGWCGVFEKERTSEYTDYTTFGILYYNDETSAFGFSPESYEMHIRLSNGSDEAEVRDIRVSVNNDDETGSASKMSFDPSKIKILEFYSGTYKLFNDAGEQDNNFESYGELYGTGVNLEEGDTYKIKLVGLDFDFGNIYEGKIDNVADYYAEFVVHDTQGQSHTLNLIHIDN